jgi:hypothetical protein
MKKELAIDTTFDSPWFSSDYTFKGTVAQDFLAWVFFVDLLYMGLGFRG